MADTKATRAAGTTQVREQEAGLLDQIVDNIAVEGSQRTFARDIIAEFAKQVLDGAMVAGKGTESMLKARIAQLDELISAQLNEIMHASEFQRLEATWRGLHYLVSQTETSTTLKIKVFNTSKRDLQKDLENAAEFDQSALYKKVYEEEFGTLGGAPFGLLVGDYEFSSLSQDVSLLERMAQVAAASHAPFISAADPKMFGMRSYQELNEPRAMSSVFDRAEYTKWQSFRESEDSKYVGLCLPHVLMREPYGRDNLKVDSFNFEEDVDGTAHDKYLWGNAAYALATRITDSFSQYGFCTAIRGAEKGGRVEGLPTHTFETVDGDVVLKCPTEVQIPDRRERELADQGFIPLMHSKGSDVAVFMSTQSTNKPATYDTDDATASAKLSSQLQYLMASCRFAHYMKAILRDKIGGFMSRANCQELLNRWINDYVLLNADNASDEQKAKRPLQEARVEVEEVPGQPGVYKAIAYLRPHFQLDGIDVSLRMVANLPQQGQGR